MFSLGLTDGGHQIEHSVSSVSVRQDALESDVDNPCRNSSISSSCYTETYSVPPSDTPPTLLQSSSHFPSRSSMGSRLDEGAESLVAMGEPYQGVWFTYDYHDLGPQRSVEECMEQLRVGVVSAAVSPDVLHRLELFHLAFQDSLKVTPSISSGGCGYWVGSSPSPSFHKGTVLASTPETATFTTLTVVNCHLYTVNSL